MTGRTFTVRLTDSQAEILVKAAAAEGKTPEDLIVDLTAHGLTAILYGLAAHDPSRVIRPEDVEEGGDDLPF